MHLLRAARAAFTVALLAHTSTTQAATHDFTLTTLFDASDVPAPSDPTRTTLFEQSGFSGNSVTTVASGSFEEMIGVFQKPLGPGPVETIVSSSSISPSTGTPILGLLFPQGDGDEVIVSAAAENAMGAIITGLYRHNGSPDALTTIIERGGSFPGGMSGVLGALGLSLYSYNNGEIAYRAFVDQDLPTERSGVYISPITGGATSVIADTTQIAPGSPGQLFEEVRIGRGALEGSVAAFFGEFNGGAGQGIYLGTAGTAPVSVAINGNALPGTAVGTPYSFSASPILSDGDIAFKASGGIAQGVYAIFDGVMTLIADTDTPLPNNPAETFNGFSVGSPVNGGYAIDDGRVLFEAAGSDGSQGVYLYDGGDISQIMRVGDILDGIEVALVDVTEGSLRGDQVVLDVILADFVNEVLHSRVMLATIASDPLPGDANGDGVVDILDLDILSGNYGTMGGATVAEGDFNGDGNVDILDLDILSGNFGSGAGLSASAPEPSSALLLLLGALAIRRAQAR